MAPSNSLPLSVMGREEPRCERSDKPPKHTKPSKIKKDFEHRDPRFSSFTCSLNNTMFEQAYSFLKERQREELKEIKKMLKTEKDSETIRKGKLLLKRVKSMQKTHKRKQKEADFVRNHIKKDKMKQKKGKKPFYLSNTAKKKLFKEKSRD